MAAGILAAEVFLEGAIASPISGQGDWPSPSPFSLVILAVRHLALASAVLLMARGSLRSIDRSIAEGLGKGSASAPPPADTPIA